MSGSVSKIPEPRTLFRTLANGVISEISPDTLSDSFFHYTSAAGLKGIIESNTLYFSDTKFVNDGSERRWGLDVFGDVADSYGSVMDEKSKNFLQAMFEKENSFSEDFRNVIFCMSLEGNLLNQWRDYGNDVVPYCIEFDADYFWKDQPANFEIKVVQLEYDHTKQKLLVEELCNRIFKIMDNHWNAADESRLEDLATEASFQFGIMLEEFKHPAFAAEREARLTVSHYNLSKLGISPKFRTSSIGLVPYYEWKPETKLAIKSVMVGPSPHAEASLDALNVFLAANGIKAKTAVSEIPIRR